jgi:RNA polymerase sigma factor (sigma-70 family)
MLLGGSLPVRTTENSCLWDRIPQFKIIAERVSSSIRWLRKAVNVTGDNSTANQWTVLVGRIRSGDSAAEEELVHLFQRSIFTIAAVRTRDREAARDLTQDVLIAVLTAVRNGQVRETEKLSAFIQGTARNLINNHFEKAARRAESKIEAAESLAADPVPALEAAELSHLVRQELEAHSALDQQILLFSLVDGHSLAEVAKRLKMSHEAVRARKSRLIRKLTKKFEGLSQK